MASDVEARILVVEDDAFIRDLLVRQLAIHGYQTVATAENGIRALEMLRAGRFDLVLLDIVMPGLDGIEVLGQVKAEPGLQSIPVIMISGIEETDQIVQCIELGAEDYLNKPFDPVILRARVGASLEKKKLRDLEASHLVWICQEQKKSDDLLNVILPAAVASELKERGVVAPRHYENVAVLFCDIVGFTAYCDTHDAAGIVSRLQTLVEGFEEIAERHQMEKIKTIGDAFMATAGAPRPNTDALNSAVRCGLDMISAAGELVKDWEVRVGVDFGQVIGGVLGRKKYQFDVWGRAVNIAARMTEYAHPGAVAMTRSAWLDVDRKIAARARGQHEIKGLGQIEIVECYGKAREKRIIPKGKIMVDKSTIRILVLDDEPFTLKLIVQMLIRQGYTQVTSCDSGKAALENLDAPNSTTDVILCDLQMPEMDGIEFVRKLGERSYTGSLILLSGEDERVLEGAAKVVQAHAITVLGHLHKPLTLERLVALLDKWSPPSTTGSRAAKKRYGANEVRAAIGNGELVNFYQPKVSLATGEVVGVETLVRWRHPQDGMVFPDQFIKVAETHALIDDLTRVVMVEALRQLKAWSNAGFKLKVAVNVSMDNLLSLDFPDYVAAQTAAAGVSANDVILEVTESRLMSDARAPLDILTRLRLKHFGLSIDDFGTGHSSLAQLRNIPFDELKVDGSFVHGASSNNTALAIFRASINLARQLHMTSVAEGVEDQADWDFLRSARCDLAQGYFIAKPMPPADLPDWMAGWHERALCKDWTRRSLQTRRPISKV